MRRIECRKPTRGGVCTLRKLHKGRCRTAAVGRSVECGHADRKHWAKGLCKPCYVTVWKKAHPDRIRHYARKSYRKNPQKHLTYARAWDQSHITRVILRGAKHRAKKQGLAFNLILEDIIIPDICPLLGIAIASCHDGRRGPAPGSPSLDRLDPNKGYVRGNVWVVSWRANSLKSDGTVEELEMLLRNWKRRIA